LITSLAESIPGLLDRLQIRAQGKLCGPFSLLEKSKPVAMQEVSQDPMALNLKTNDPGSAKGT